MSTRSKGIGPFGRRPLPSSSTSQAALKTPAAQLAWGFVAPPNNAPVEHHVHRHQFNSAFVLTPVSIIETTIPDTRSFLVTHMELWADWINDLPANPAIPDQPTLDYHEIVSEIDIRVDDRPMLQTTERVAVAGVAGPVVRNGLVQVRLGAPGIIPLNLALYEGQTIRTEVINPVTIAPTVSIVAEIGVRFIGHTDFLQSK